MSSPLTALDALWRQLRPRVDPHAGSRRLVAALGGGARLGEALAASAEVLAGTAVSTAAERFEGGALALFIADVRDALQRQLREAAAVVKDGPLAEALRQAARAVADETFVQHLINALLAATDLYVEAEAVGRLDEARCARAVSALFRRSLCVLVSRAGAARVAGAPGRDGGFTVLPAPSQP